MRKVDPIFLQKKELAFSKGTPTAFIVESTFQLLCAQEAIKEFGIEDYHIVLVLDRKSARNQQLFSVLDKTKMPYDIWYMGEFKIVDQWPTPDDSIRRFDRVMLGGYHDNGMLSIAGRYASKDSVCVFCDDGTMSISILTGKSTQDSPIISFIRKLLGKGKGFVKQRLQVLEKWEEVGLYNGNFFYTIFADIKTSRFTIYKNSLSHIGVFNSASPSKVLIVGTVIHDFAEMVGLKEDELLELLRRLLVQVQQLYPCDNVIYIPHGRDNNAKVPIICQELNVDYHPLKMTIEEYVIVNKINVKTIYGFFSTALYTLKLLTKAEVINWNIVHISSRSWYSLKFMLNYYRSHGIVIQDIDSGLSLKSRLTRYVGNYIHFNKHS